MYVTCANRNLHFHKFAWFEILAVAVPNILDLLLLHFIKATVKMTCWSFITCINKMTIDIEEKAQAEPIRSVLFP